MTTFGHDCSASSSEIHELLEKISNAPKRGMKFMFGKILITFFPSLIKLPTPVKLWSGRLKEELGRIAEDVWSGGAKGEAHGMHSKVLDLIGESPFSFGCMAL